MIATLVEHLQDANGLVRACGYAVLASYAAWRMARPWQNGMTPKACKALVRRARICLAIGTIGVVATLIRTFTPAPLVIDAISTLLAFLIIGYALSSLEVRR